MRLLDLFCGAGGAAMGYHHAGFEVIGVDINQQPDYPFEFHQMSAFMALVLMDDPPPGGRRFDAIHASPPCQASTALTKGTNKGRQYPQLIPATRDALEATGLPYVIENVQGADVRRDLTLCGEMFGLGVIRHRYFELGGWTATAPAHRPHRGRVRGWRHGTYYDGPYVAVYGDGGGKGSVAEWQAAMGIDWTDDRKAIAEAIPPAYTEHIGLQLAEHLRTAGPMISARPITCPFLGRRWRTHCHRCGVDLPGRYADRHDAETAGGEHVGLRHAGAGV